MPFCTLIHPPHCCSVLFLFALLPFTPHLFFLNFFTPPSSTLFYCPSPPSHLFFDLSYPLPSLSLSHQVPFKRAVFHEITKDAILKSFENPREIDMNIVQSQETRRSLPPLLFPPLSFPSHTSIPLESYRILSALTFLQYGCISYRRQ